MKTTLDAHSVIIVFAPFWLPLAAVLAVYGCASFPSAGKEMQAETAYSAEEYHTCVEPLPVLGPSATKEARAAAWASFDACRVKVREHWSETVTDAGGEQ